MEGAGCRVQGAGCRVQGAGCRVWGVGCGVWGVGLGLAENEKVSRHRHGIQADRDQRPS